MVSDHAPQLDEPTAPSFHAAVTRTDDRALIRVEGKLDMVNAQLLEGWMAAMDRPVVAVDLAAVTFIDSSGVGVLLRARRQLADDGVHFQVRNPSGSVRRVLEILGVGEVLVPERHHH
jgi:anti-anti-sigma factor